MSKLVVYNGKCEDIYGSSPPCHLVIGEVYEVVSIQYLYRHPEYLLKGYPGQYNSKWFDDISNMQLAISDTSPQIGKIEFRYKCFLVGLKDGKPCYNEIEIHVAESHIFGIDIYKIIDFEGNIYIVKVY